MTSAKGRGALLQTNEELSTPHGAGSVLREFVKSAKGPARASEKARSSQSADPRRTSVLREVLGRRELLFSPLALPLLAQTGFEPLFNGRDLADFDVDTPGLWAVEDGVIVGRSEGLKYNDFLRTRKSYSHFALKVTFKMTDPSGRANSGIQFRSKPVPNSHEVSGYQADIGQQYWGCLYDESRRNRVLAQAMEGSLDGLDKAGWNTYTITAQGPRIRLELNDRLTVDYTETDPAIPVTGFIALQLHSGPPLEMRFRDLSIRQLP